MVVRQESDLSISAASQRLSMKDPRLKAFVVLMIMIITIFQETCSSSFSSYPSSTCGNINIKFPFQLGKGPYYYYVLDVGGPRLSDTVHAYALSCINNLTILYLESGERFYVQAINYDNYTIRVRHVDAHNCSSVLSSSSSLTRSDSQFLYYEGHNPTFETEIRFRQIGSEKQNWAMANKQVKTRVYQLTETIMFLSCENPVLNNPFYIDTSPCFNISTSSLFSSSSETRPSYSYVVHGNGFKFSDMKKSCTIYHTALISPSSPQRRHQNRRKNITSYKDVHKELLYGFELSWVQAFRQVYGHDGLCYVDEDSNKVHCPPKPTAMLSASSGAHPLFRFLERLATGLHKAIYYLEEKERYTYILYVLEPRTIVGVLFVIALVIYKWRRRHLSSYDGIEEFLQSYNNLMPIRYTYYEVKEMTKGFKNKLGEGGFGSVYKGELRSGNSVAVKMLGNTKANGQDFINEVATIGRIHHLNVVRLIGFCVEGSKRALIYDFMQNGSLDKFIFSAKELEYSLDYRSILKISVGIAHGIEYLHRGCDMQILHFDIKPHNILLDENFIPKVSDFGLARLCPLNNSTVSLTAARGTIGYIAPELFYKNIGGVSSKADVYSFGMLLMEMANRRKNVNANAENSSQIYFPLWVYDQVSKGKKIEIEGVTEVESQTVKKMIITALWCIQLKPCERPSMNQVIEMLEGEVESLQMPPKPCLYPQDNHMNAEDAGATSNKSTCSSALSDEDAPDITLVSN